MKLDVLFFSLAQLMRPGAQTGTPAEMTWEELAEYLAKPSIAENKKAAGGFSPALYRGNVRRKEVLVRVWVLIVDIDGNGDVDRIADEFALYDAITLETFSSTNDDPRCRLLIRLAEAVGIEVYEQSHLIVRDILKRQLGAITDDGAKDASRLSYCPVRRDGAGYRYRVTQGRPLDAKRLIASQPPPPPRPRVEVKAEHASAYHAAAMRRAAQNVASAPEGTRHETLNREAYALARLDLSPAMIRDALFSSAIAAMGESRRGEVERTIADAIRARKAGS